MSEQNTNLDKYKQNTKILEDLLNLEQENWDNLISKLGAKLKGDIKFLYEVDADISSYKQIITSEMRKYALLIYKENKV